MRRDPSTSKSELDVLPLQGKSNLPLRLYMQDGRPVTDKKGYLLRNIVGAFLANVNLSRREFQDLKGQNLIDATGRISSDRNFDPTEVPSFEKDGKDPTLDLECSTIIYDINGFPLTDKKGQPLASKNGQMYLIFGPRGDPISDLLGRDIIDKLGKVVTAHKPIKDKTSEKPLFFFDYEGRPLTDGEGFPLLDITGLKMIVFTERNTPSRSISGSALYDAAGLAKYQDNCDFTKRPPKINSNLKVLTEIGNSAVAFDSSGYPLTDLAGFPLCFNNGTCMITYSQNKWVAYDGDSPTIVPRKIYSRLTLNGFVNSSGLPIRIFDDYGRALTDIAGTPQRHATGKVLIKFDKNGAPTSDWLDRPLYDANGNINSSRKFRPCVPFRNNELVQEIIKNGSRGVQYFECTGMPLTNTFGIPLINSKEELMLTFDRAGEPVCDFRKRTVYNVLGLPMCVSLNVPLRGPGGIAIRLYDLEGRPLTARNGLPLKDLRGRCMLRVYSKGLGIMDLKGRDVYDKNGYSTKFAQHFNACGGADTSERQETVISASGEAMLLFDEEGYPLTEDSGLVLCNRMGVSMIKCPEKGFTLTLDEKPVYDVNGRKCLKTFSKNIGLSVGLYDKNSRPLTDRNGSVLHNRKGQELVLFGKDNKPFSAMIGGELYDFKGMPLKNPFADPSQIAKDPSVQMPDGIQLFDCQDLPLTDVLGYTLYTSYGIPMVTFDSYSRVKCDHSGRPVFDIRGLAASRTSGAWKDQSGMPYRLFTANGKPLTDEDGRELFDIEGKPLIRQDKVGRPKFAADDSFVWDCKKRRFIDASFKPTTIPSNTKKTTPLVEENQLPLRIFDVDGDPLTDTLGRPLVNSKGVLLINLSNGLHRITDSSGRQVYDQYKMPLGCSCKTQLKMMNGLPLILYDDKGKPLTDQSGRPEKKGNKIVIIFDKYGRPSSTEDGTKLYDHAGRCSLHPQFGLSHEIINNQKNIESSTEPLIVEYDRSGIPFKDINGCIVQR